MLNKEGVYKEACAVLNMKIADIQSVFDDLRTAITSDSKSTAGDKHETGRAMLHLEQEKLSRQLVQLNQLKEALGKIDPAPRHEMIQFGSLIHCSKGYFFLSVGIGEIQFKNEKIYCLTPVSPLGKSLIGKSAGDSVKFNGKDITIFAVS